MATIGTGIARIEIDRLWNGGRHVAWTLRPDVNVLSGRNGEGKSTILNHLVRQLRAMPRQGEIAEGDDRGVRIDFTPAEATCVRYEIIRSFDRELLHGDMRGSLSETLADVRVLTELDWQLYLLQRRYLDYQVNVGNRMIQLLTSGSPEAPRLATEASQRKTRFQDIVDELFSETGKRIDRTSNELLFTQYDQQVRPHMLSSGEKQMLIILLTALTQDNQHYVLFMDEPEASLHFEWQRRLIALIRELNPNAQIILTTHSPAVILDGWQDCVTEVSDITV